MKFVEKFPEKKGETKIKQLNLMALLHASRIIRFMLSSTKEVLPFYSRMSHRKSTHENCVISTVVLAYKDSDKRATVFRYAVRTLFRRAQDSWVLWENSEAEVMVEHPLSGECIGLSARVDAYNNLHLTEVSKAQWRTHMLQCSPVFLH
jgi:hypothetical protein